MKKFFEKKSIKRTVAAVFWLSLVLWAGLLYMADQGLRLLYPWIESVLILLMIFSGTVHLAQGAARVEQTWLRRLLKSGLSVAVLGVLAVFMYVEMGLSVLVGTKVISRHTSPYNPNHQLVVLEGGFIDTAYSAQPVKYGVFYGKQNDIWLSKHDFWGDAGIQVEWREDGATVYILFWGAQERQEEDSIPIRFTD